ncbi:hypothetical protein Q8F55_008540 [Vanrija albida]|uniref:LIM zinc-binding domain-containing protein n=1 Tax=Vanrija albida TaxID=181172 RepID=A0ABR3PS53_9TREE
MARLSQHNTSDPPAHDVLAAEALLHLHPGRGPSEAPADTEVTPVAQAKRPAMLVAPPSTHRPDADRTRAASTPMRDVRRSFSRDFLTPESRTASPARRRRTSTRSKSPHPPDPTRANAAGRKDYPGLDPADLAIVMRFPQRQRSKNARYLSFIGNSTLRMVPPGRGCATCERAKIPCFVLDRESVQHTNHSRCFSCGNTACSFTRSGGPPRDLPPRSATEEARVARAMIVATIPPPGMLPPTGFRGTPSRHASRSVTPSPSTLSTAYTEVTTPPDNGVRSPSTSPLVAPKPVRPASPTDSFHPRRDASPEPADRRRHYAYGYHEASYRAPHSPSSPGPPVLRHPSSPHHPLTLPALGHPQVNIPLQPIHRTLPPLRLPLPDKRRFPGPPARFIESLWPEKRRSAGANPGGE